MPFQFRFWKNFGPFRVNASRSGVTGSWGTRWFRFLFNSKGVRTTARVPRKGLSHVKFWRIRGKKRRK